MIDGSAQEYGKNVELTRRIVSWADYINIPVEGELGHVGKAVDDIAADTYTDPGQAKDFAQKTGVSLLAVMVGSAHGMYKKEPKLDIERIAEIRSSANIPLVLHGGSGIPNSEIRKAIDAGISKINVATSICLAYYEGFKHLGETDEMYKKPLDVFMTAPKVKVIEFLEDRIELFGAAGKA
jgi:tagatose 1,6-diphosphate aldolase GatY/KbaY